MRGRLLRGIGANLYGQGATALVQLASVPLLVAAWGPSRFGAWTLLTALPAALAFADGGLVLASGNAMTMLAARGQYAAAAALYRSAIRRVTATVAGAILVAVLAIHLAPDGWTARLAAAEAGADPRLLLDLLALATGLGVLATLPAAALRADGGYAAATTASTTLRLLETGAVVATALAGGSLGAAVLALAAARLAAVPLLFRLARRGVPWLATRDDAAGLPPLLRPAAAALLLPACFALGLQGVTLAIGLSQPPAAVAAFAAARTLARTLVQAVGLVIHALMPEMSRAAGSGDAAAVATVLRWSRGASLALLVPGWLLLLAAGPAVFAAWTGGRLPLPAGTLPLLASAAALHGAWLSRANLMLAVNRQGDYAGAFLVATLVTVALAAAATRVAGLPGAAAATLIGETAMVLHLARLATPPCPAARSGPEPLRA